MGSAGSPSGRERRRRADGTVNPPVTHARALRSKLSQLPWPRALKRKRNVHSLVRLLGRRVDRRADRRRELPARPHLRRHLAKALFVGPEPVSPRHRQRLRSIDLGFIIEGGGILERTSDRRPVGRGKRLRTELQRPKPPPRDALGNLPFVELANTRHDRTHARLLVTRKQGEPPRGLRPLIAAELDLDHRRLRYPFRG